MSKYDEIVTESLNDMPHLQSNGLYLSQNQINILKRNNINYESCTSVRQLIMLIEEELTYDESEELENLSIELSDFDYYHNYNK